ncbi:MAG: protein translocase subunit SecD [Planctomycetota bacterium]|jgi:SecD/SecF fusion protein
MRHLLRNSIFVVLMLLICSMAIVPPSEKLRKGRDLAGGTSLIYSVSVDPGEPVDQVLANTIEVLKKRVDPNGLYEIAMVRQGQNRIEITMPLPTPEVQSRKDLYEAALAELVRYKITSEDLDRIARMDEQQRQQVVDEYAQGDPAREALFVQFFEAKDNSEDAEAQYRGANEDPLIERFVLDELLNEAGRARELYQSRRELLLRQSFDPDELAFALEQLSDQKRNLQDSTVESGVRILPSPREAAIARLKAQHPALNEQIDAVIVSFDHFASIRRGLDDANDLIRLLRGAGVLEFRITVDPGELAEERQLRTQLQAQGPRAATPGFKWLALNDVTTWVRDATDTSLLQAAPSILFQQYGYVVEERDGQYWLLVNDATGLRLTKAEGDWGLQSAFNTQDQLGRPAIGFRMDPNGARLLGSMTGANVGKRMAVVLDDQVYTAPNLNSRISSQGVIEGQFSPQDITYIRDTLAAGSLSAKLSEDPISQVTIAPELGADNLTRGFLASMFALVAVAVFMLVYYFGCGVVAVISLACNAIMILGVMSLSRAAFTLPGIAGIVLTFGMAVDANVLIYERIREELEDGADIRTAIRLGYQKVLSTILDANITNLIVCLVLYRFATQEIKGFAVTLGVGIVCTLISALIISRLIFSLMEEAKKAEVFTSQLPTAIRSIQRLLSPSVNWLGLRPVFIVISLAYISLGVGMVYTQGANMLDNEFRGGTAVDMALDDGQTSTRQEMQDRLAAYINENPDDTNIQELINAELVAINPQSDGVTSDRFRLKTTLGANESGTGENIERQVVEEAIASAFGDLLAQDPPLDFVGSESEFDGAPVYPILQATLGDNIEDRSVLDDVSEYLGGVAIVLDDLSPQPSLESLQSRIQLMRQTPEFSSTQARAGGTQILIIEGTEEAISRAVVVVLDPDFGYFDDAPRWQSDLAQEEWSLVSSSLTSLASSAGLQQFDAQIAKTYQGQAIVAMMLSLLGIMAYIWFRFGSLRYSMAAIVALLHDVITVVGLIALAEIIYNWNPSLAGSLLIEPFKIDLGLIAALLTIIGYSLNDTIVILDRVRENRGKLSYASAEVVNKSINQTISRTIITSGTTLIAVLIMYSVGGTGIRSFTYALLCGVFVGTYSSIAVAAPLVYTRKGTGPHHTHKTHEELETTPSEEQSLSVA